MFVERLDYMREIFNSILLPDDVYELGSRLLDHLRIVDSYFSEQGIWDTDSGIQLAEYLQQSFDKLRDALAAVDVDAVMFWVRDSSARLFTTLDFFQKYSHGDDVYMTTLAEETAEINQRSVALQDRLIFERDRQKILDSANEAAERANLAADKAQESAGITGGASLADHFATYAADERRAAVIYRRATIVAISAAFVGAIIFGPIEANDWSHLTYRVAVVAGAGTLAAYFARQAGQHRRIHNWARSLEVQLLSFPAFIEPLRDEERSEAYRALARRILSSPPEKGADTTDESVGAGQLVELASALAKRT